MTRLDVMSSVDFLERAIEFLPVPDGPPFPEIRLHQASIAFELATKAAILHGGGTHADCLRARHDLVAGLDAARRYGFTATDAAQATARTLTPFYSTHRLDELARDPGAADVERLCIEAAAQVARVHAWMQFCSDGGSKGGFAMPTMWDDWKPISTAPNNKHILLGWSDGGAEYDFLFDAGELHDGEWLDGDRQPDWWMDGPPPPPRKRQD